MVVLQLRVVPRLFFLHGPGDVIDEIIHALLRIVALAANACGKLVRSAEGIDFVQARLDAGNAHAYRHFVLRIDERDEFIAGVAQNNSHFADNTA
jgi:hypothetical protein